jgi:predicted secreted protein
MTWPSALAIYILFWVLCAFIIMPIGMKAANEAGDPLIPGQSESAPARFQPRRIIGRTTILSLLMFGAYYANYVQGWITPDMLDFTRL